MNENISVISSRNPKERIPLLLNILYEYGINEKKSIYVQSFDVNSSYYINHLISLISKIDFKLVDSYMFPVGAKSNKLKSEKIDTKKFVSAIEEIRNSDIVISSSKIFNQELWLDYVFDIDSIKPYQVIIIDNFNEFVLKTEEYISTVRKRINEYSKKYNAEIILFINDSDIPNYNTHFKISDINKPFKFEYDKSNHSITNIEED